MEAEADRGWRKARRGGELGFGGGTSLDYEAQVLGWLWGHANANARTIYGRADVRVAPGRARKRVARSVPCPTRVRLEEEENDADVWASFVSVIERGGGGGPLPLALAAAGLRLGPRRRGKEPGLLARWARGRRAGLVDQKQGE